MGNKILEKAQKLLAMGKGGTIHEQEIAMAKLQRLMTENKLDMQSIEGFNPEPVDNEKVWTGKKQLTRTEWSITHILTRFYNVRIVGSHGYIGGHRQAHFHFVGREQDVQIAKYVFHYLNRAFNRLWKLYRAENGLVGKSRDRNSFMVGLSQGLIEKLSEEKAKVQQERGLVVVADLAVNDEFNRLFPRTRSSRSNVNVGNSAFGAGHSAGKSINISSGVTNQGQRQIG